MQPYNPALRQTARYLRSNMTDAEQILWRHLRRKQVCGVTFYRQKPLLTFIVDFYCPRARLVVELDGGQHFTTAHQGKDQARDAALSSLGMKVLRFNNLDVMQQMESVLMPIHSEVTFRLSTET